MMTDLGRNLKNNSSSSFLNLFNGKSPKLGEFNARTFAKRKES